LVDLYSHTTRHVDLKSLHLEVLNIRSSPEPCTIEELIPRSADDTEFYPRWQVEPAVEEEFIKVGPNGRPIRPVLTIEERLRKDFLERLSELETDNDAAFRVLNKRNLPGVRPPRVATMRKFWAQLENLSHYWDTSLDDYFQMPITEHHAENQRPISDADETKSGEEESPSAKSPKRQRVDNGQDVMLSGTATTPDGSNDDSDDIVDTIMTDDELSQSEDDDKGISTSTEETQQQSVRLGRPRYKGRRIGTGRDMHERFRSDALLAFVEGCAWPFNSTVIPPRKSPVVRFANLNIPIKQLACVYRLPNDGARRRAGWIQGPVIGLQARAEVEFSGEVSEDVSKEEEAAESLASSSVEQATLQDSDNGIGGSSVKVSSDEKMEIDVPDSESTADATTDVFRKPAIPSSQNPKPRASKKKPPPVVNPADRARLDILREIGLLLEIAQERYREGKSEDKPGVGKWWTEKPRFGGGKAGTAGGNEKVADQAVSPSSDKANVSNVRVDPAAAPPSRLTSSVTSRPATTASPTTLDFLSLRNKNGAGGATTVNGLGKSTPSTNSSADTLSANSDSATAADKPANTIPVHPPMPPSSTSITTSKPSTTIDPILAAASTATATFANEMFARYQRKERKSPAAMWEILRCPTATWDAKTEYRAIGKDKTPPPPSSSLESSTRGGGGDPHDTKIKIAQEPRDNTSKKAQNVLREGPGEPAPHSTNPSSSSSSSADPIAGKSPWDEVFLVSSLNHHISILRLTVHDAYLEYLLSGKMPSPSSASTSTSPESSSSSNENENGNLAKEEKEHWSIPRLRRSEWFDLLDPKGRCDAFRALWGVMAYLNRGEEIW
jgi:hypothetical protein